MNHQLNAIISSLEDMIFELDENYTFLNVWSSDPKLFFISKKNPSVKLTLRWNFIIFKNLYQTSI